MTNEEMALQVQKGDRHLIPQLWEGMRNLICQLANRFYIQQRERCEATGVTTDDLIQEGLRASHTASP